jgi:hypothetical protein
MTTEFSCCLTRPLPSDLQAKAAAIAYKINPANILTPDPARPSPERLTLDTTHYWGKGGPHLTVSFCEPSVPMNLQARIVRWMNYWSHFCNCNFTLHPAGGQVRITLVPGQGNWSYLGTQTLAIPAPQPTTWLDGITTYADVDYYGGGILHEAGHVLGWEHEHQRADCIARLDRAKTLAWYRQFGWSDADTEAYVLTPLDPRVDQMSPGGADTLSIMAYYFPGSITKDGRPIGGASMLSKMDERMAGAWYPLPAPKKAPTIQEHLAG